MTLLVDSGVFLAYADASDKWHEACVELLEAEPGALLTTDLVVAETGWLIERQLGPHAEEEFYLSIVDGEIEVEHLGLTDWTRVADLTRTYADNGLGGVDSSLVAVAERLKLDTVATLDQRHFRVVRPKHIEAFKIVP